MSTITAPVIELKKFRYFAEMSEETSAYVAEVWVDGKRGFHAKNDGHGGDDRYGPIWNQKTQTHDHEAHKAAMATLEAYAATLPPKPWPADWNLSAETAGDGMKQDVETLIGDAVSAKLADREVARIVRAMAKGDRVWALKGADLLSLNCSPAPKNDTVGWSGWRRAALERARPGYVVLTGLPVDEQRKLIRAAIL